MIVGKLPAVMPSESVPHVQICLFGENPDHGRSAPRDVPLRLRA